MYKIKSNTCNINLKQIDTNTYAFNKYIANIDYSKIIYDHFIEKKEPAYICMFLNYSLEGENADLFSKKVIEMGRYLKFHNISMINKRGYLVFKVCKHDKIKITRNHHKIPSIETDGGGTILHTEINKKPIDMIYGNSTPKILEFVSAKKIQYEFITDGSFSETYSTTDTLDGLIKNASHIMFKVSQSPYRHKYAIVKLQ